MGDEKRGGGSGGSVDVRTLLMKEMERELQTAKPRSSAIVDKWQEEEDKMYGMAPQDGDDDGDDDEGKEEKKEKEPEDDRPENPVRFVGVIQKALIMCEDHLRVTPSQPGMFYVPPDEAYVHYWSRSTPHHWSAPSNTKTLYELVWMTRAYIEAVVNPTKVNAAACIDRNITEMANQMRQFANTWVITPFTKIDEYQQRRSVFVSMLVFEISKGIQRLMDEGKIKKPQPSLPSNKEGKEEKKKEKEQEKGEDGKPLLGETINANSSKLAKAVDELKDSFDLFNGVQSVVEWIPQCARLFSYVDVCLYMFKRWPVIPVVPAVPNQIHSEAKMSGWFRFKVKHKMPEEFNVAVMSLSCRLALPIGAIDAYKRNVNTAPPSTVNLFESAYKHERMMEMKKAVYFTHTQIIYKDPPLKQHTMRYVRDAVILWTYHHQFHNHVPKVHWITRYFVDANNLREAFTNIESVSDMGQPRLPIIIHIADTYYVHDCVNLYAMRDIEQALWYWTYRVTHVHKSTTADDHLLFERWTKDFLV